MLTPPGTLPEICYIPEALILIHSIDSGSTSTTVKIKEKEKVLESRDMSHSKVIKMPTGLVSMKYCRSQSMRLHG